MSASVGTIKEFSSLLMHGANIKKKVLSIFINLYMFRVNMCPSSRETAVFLRHLALVIVCG
jgi:hypothetical protein